MLARPLSCTRVASAGASSTLHLCNGTRLCVQNHRRTQLAGECLIPRKSAPQSLKSNPKRLQRQTRPPSSGQHKKHNWKAKHEAFVHAIRAARGENPDAGGGGGGSSASRAPPIANPDYVQCPHCQRRFEENSATRHIPFCAEKAKREALKKGSRNAKAESVKKRTTYKPPKLKPRANASEKSTSRSARPPSSARTSATRGSASSATSRRQPQLRVSPGDDQPLPTSGRRPTAGVGSATARRRPSSSSRPPTTSQTNVSARSAARNSRVHGSMQDDYEPPRSPRTLAPVYDSRSPRGSASSQRSVPCLYCGDCGSELAAIRVPKFCIRCGSRFAERAKFCPECGHQRA
eukprot:m.299167 g.299167  ORF g.299167 m.299167 type:complete len:348 (+) comp19544_c0_seq6:200-1243(+)